MNEYLDLTHEYRILIPLNKNAMNMLYRGEISQLKNGFDCKEIVFYEDMYYYLEENLFNFINIECDVLINMYEEEIVDTAKLNKLLDITKLMIRNNREERFLTFANQFIDDISVAIKAGTCVGFFF